MNKGILLAAVLLFLSCSSDDQNGYEPTPMPLEIPQIFSEIIKNGGRNQFFDYLIQMAQSPDLNQKIKLFETLFSLNFKEK